MVSTPNVGYDPSEMSNDELLESLQPSPSLDGDGPVTVGEFDPPEPDSGPDSGPDGPRVLGPYDRLHDHVIIVGYAHTRLDVPWEREDTEFWGINTLHMDPNIRDKARWHRWFEIHDVEKFYVKPNNREHLKFLATCRMPVYLRHMDVGKIDCPSAAPMPVGDLIDTFGNYFNNTISYLIGLAVLMEYKRIGLYGVDMAQDDVIQAEYSSQRPSCEFMLGVAAGRGIEIEIAPGADLLKTSHLYGYSEGPEMRVVQRRRLDELQSRLQQLQNELGPVDSHRANLIAQINQIHGAINDTQFWMRNRTTPEAVPLAVPEVADG